jgi:hypothetical protein
MTSRSSSTTTGRAFSVKLMRRGPHARVPCPTSERLLVAGLLDLSVEADMDRNKGLAGEKPLSAVDSERPGACFSKRLKQGVVRTR